MQFFLEVQNAFWVIQRSAKVVLILGYKMLFSGYKMLFSAYKMLFSEYKILSSGNKSLWFTKIPEHHTNYQK